MARMTTAEPAATTEGGPLHYMAIHPVGLRPDGGGPYRKGERFTAAEMFPGAGEEQVLERIARLVDLGAIGLVDGPDPTS